MKKPLHWSEENRGHENRAILSAVYLLEIGKAIYLSEYDLTEEERDSAFWSVWECDKKRLRPHVYSLQKSMYKLLLRIISKSKKKHKSIQGGKEQ